MSIALRVLPSKLELKRRDASGILASRANVSFTTFVYASPVCFRRNRVGTMKRVLIIGGVAAAMKAAATASRRDSKLEIVVLQDELEVSFSACGFPYHLADPVAIPRQRLIARSVERFRQDGIDVRVGQ
jgi:hypothetical protein